MLSTEYRESIERRFHAFCKAILHNEDCNYYRERKRRTQCEISFEYLQENTSFAPCSTDKYFVLQDKPTAFEVNGQTVIVDSEKLAKALLCLSESWREIIFMHYGILIPIKMAFYCVTKRTYRRLDDTPVLLCTLYGSYPVSVCCDTVL